ncbi:MAG: ligase-associated DNA damage response endonuclease PdeM [Pseudomonadota bacterium]
MSNAFGTSAMRAFTLPGQIRQPRPARPRPPARRAFVAGMDALLDPSGALYWPAERTLVVSDLHLETGSSYARQGQMLPPYDSSVTLARLAEVTRHYTPHRIISLGDSFHDPFGAERLLPHDVKTLRGVMEGAEMIWITGNHDHASAARFGGAVFDEFCLAGVTFRHIPTEGSVFEPEVAGHLHPAASGGSGIRRPVFIGCEVRLVMPAFGCLAGGVA